jgi:hypothetical protein
MGREDTRQLMLGLIDDVPDERRGARQLMMWGLVGLAVALFAGGVFVTAPRQNSTVGSGQNASGETARIEQTATLLQLSDAQRQQIRQYFASKPGQRTQGANFSSGYFRDGKLRVPPPRKRPVRLSKNSADAGVERRLNHVAFDRGADACTSYSRCRRRSDHALTVVRMSFVSRRIPYTCTAPEPVLDPPRRDLTRRTFGICCLYESCPA